MAISERDRKLLWGRSGNRCAICKRELLEPDTPHDPAALIGEECHIVAQSDGGPRAGSLPSDQVDRYDNLLLLCRNHHRMVDGQPLSYPVERLRQLKLEHEADVRRRLDWMMPPAPEPSHPDPTAEAEALPAHEKSETLFSWRLADAFPGSRGLIEITDPIAALDRVDIVFRPPIHQVFREDTYDRVVPPFWWFRGGMNLQISSYRRDAPDTCLLDAQELQVARIVAYRTVGSPLRDFLYVETQAMPPSGAYPYAEGEIEELRGRLGGYFVAEEYALWQGRVITRSEYDDGAAMVDGRPVRIHGAELRIRYLTPFNLIICGNRHVINEPRYDRQLTALMDGLLRGDRTLDELVVFVEDLRVPLRMQLDDWG